MTCCTGKRNVEGIDGQINLMWQKQMSNQDYSRLNSYCQLSIKLYFITIKLLHIYRVKQKIFNDNRSLNSDDEHTTFFNEKHQNCFGKTMD